MGGRPIEENRGQEGCAGNQELGVQDQELGVRDQDAYRRSSVRIRLEEVMAEIVRIEGELHDRDRCEVRGRGG